MDPFSAAVNTISNPPGEYDRKVEKMCIRDRLIATPEYTTVGEGGTDNGYNIYQTGTLLLVCLLDLSLIHI